jgi:hypothetical protein
MEKIGDLRPGQDVRKATGDWSTVGRGGPSPLDSCQSPPKFSVDRFALFTLLFLAMFPGSVVLFILLAGRSYGIQLASLVGYTSAIVLYTFSRNRGSPRYLFRCPYVRLVLPRLILRHLGFLVALIALETEALRIRPHLPPSWLVDSGRHGSMPPFIAALFILFICLAFIEVISNRAVLRRAHAEGTPDQNGEVLSSR